MSTIFEKIIKRDVPAEILHEDEICIAIRDVNPQAPVHALVIPKKVISRIANAREGDSETIGHLLLVAGKVARSEQLDDGFRIVINNGTDGGETVPHLHVHLLNQDLQRASSRSKRIHSKSNRTSKCPPC